MQDEEYVQAEELLQEQDTDQNADAERLQKEREYQEQWDKLTLTSDFIFGKVMQDRTICKLIIEILLGVKIAKLTYLEEQKIMDVTLDAKGVRLDVYLEGDGRIYNVEMQVADEKNLAKRSRYYQAMIDINTLSKGKKYQKLKESFVIFICAFDPFGENLPRYTFENRCNEKNELTLQDGTQKLFFNATASEFADSELLREFLKYLTGKPAESNEIKKIDDYVKTVKSNQKWRLDYMAFCAREQDLELKYYQRGMQQGMQRGIQEGVQQGAQKKQVETIWNCLDLFDDDTTIFKITGAPLSEIRRLRKEKHLNDKK